MRLRRLLAIGVFVLSVYRGYRGLRSSLRSTTRSARGNARLALKRAYKAM